MIEAFEFYIWSMPSGSKLPRGKYFKSRDIRDNIFLYNRDGTPNKYAWSLPSLDIYPHFDESPFVKPHDFDGFTYDKLHENQNIP